MGVYLGNTDLVGGGGGEGGIVDYVEVGYNAGEISRPDGANLAVVSNYQTGSSSQSFGLSVYVPRDTYAERKGTVSSSGICAKSTGNTLCYYGCGQKSITFYKIPEGSVKGYIDILVVGGGAGARQGSCGCSSSSCYYGRRDTVGSAGGVILIQHYPLTKYVYEVSAGKAGGCTGDLVGCPSFFGPLYAYGGGASERVSAGQGCSDGVTYKQTIGTKGLIEACGGGGGAGGAGTDGYISGTILYGGNGGNGIQTDIDGTLRWYAGGAGNGGYYGCVCNAYTIQAGTNGCGYDYCGGTAAAGSGNCGKHGIVVLRYKADGSCGVSGLCLDGSCCKLCNGYCIYSTGYCDVCFANFTYN